MKCQYCDITMEKRYSERLRFCRIDYYGCANCGHKDHVRTEAPDSFAEVAAL